MRGYPALTAVAGGGFAAAVVVELLAFPGGANSSDPPATTAGYYLHHGSSDLIADYISFAAVPLLLLYLCGRGRGTSAVLDRVLTASAAAGAIFELAATAVEMSLAGSVARTAPDTTTAALYQVSSRFFFVSLLWLGIAIGALTIGATPGWERWLGALTSAVLVVASLAVGHPHGPVGTVLPGAELLLVVWVVAGVATQLRRPSGQPAVGSDASRV